MSNSPVPTCPRGFFQFEGKAPDGVAGAWFVLAKDAFMGHIRSDGNRSKQLEAALIPQVVAEPTGIWQGLERDGKQHALCYVGIPSGRMLKDTTIEVPPQPGMVFAVYIGEKRAASGQFRIEYWEHLPEDPEAAGYPEKHRRRYGKRLWPPD